MRLWWGEIRDELLAGIEFSAEQKRQVDAIGERAGKDALESLRLQRSLAAAQRGGDAERERLLRGEIRRFAWRASPRGAWTR